MDSKYRDLLLIMALVITILGTTPASASVSLSFDPLLVERVGQPGGTIGYQINIGNNNRFEPLPLEIIAMDVKQSPYGVYTVSSSGSTSYSLSDWLKIEPARIVVPPGESRSVTVTVTIPRGASGGRYGAIVAQVVPDKASSSDDGVGITFLYQAVSFLELTISGNPSIREAYIESFDVNRSSEFYSIQNMVGPDALVFSVGVQNAGNGHVVANGELILSTSGGRTVARYPLGSGRGVILPDTTAYLQTVRTTSLPEGDYQARAIVNYGGRRPLVSTMNFSVEETAVSSEQASLTHVLPSRFIVVPDNIEINLRPGAFQSTIIEITNRGEENIDVEGYVLPLAFDLQGSLVPEEERDEPVSWIELSPQSFSVAPGRTRRIRLTMRPPRDLQESYFADILFESVGEGSKVESGTNLMAIVGDDLERLGSVEIVRAEQVDGGLAVDVLFQNEGPSALAVMVELVMNRTYPQVEEEGGRIIRSYTETIASVEMPVSANPVLPGAQRLFSFLVPSGLEDGEYELAVRVGYGGEEPAIARLGISVGGEVNE